MAFDMSIISCRPLVMPGATIVPQKGNERDMSSCFQPFTLRNGRIKFQGSSSAPFRSSKSRPFNARCSKKIPSTGLRNSIESADSIIEYIMSGSLAKKVGFSSSSVKDEIVRWMALGEKLSEQLGFSPIQLSESEKIRVYQYYLPVYFWCLKQLESKSKPVVFGISAPQGCGKTTVVESLEYLFEVDGRRAASVSIDDFYLTFEQQVNLAKSFPENKLLELRGNAGSHDLELGTQTLNSLKSMAPSSSVRLPRYNKSANSGRGDRAKPETWPVVESTPDVILFEGWMLGFEPITSEAAQKVDPQLVAVNERLREYSQWHQFVDCWIIIEVEDPSWVYNWRKQAEVRMKSQGKAGMSDEEVADFVSRYMPAYKAYLPGLYTVGPTGAEPEHSLKFRIDQHRSPLL